MTNLELAHEAGFHESLNGHPMLERFADLVRADERERCIGIIFGNCSSDNEAQRIVEAIRGKA